LSNFSNFSWGFAPPDTKLNISLSYHSSASSTTLEDDIENQDEHDLVADFSVSSVERSAHCVSVVNVVRRSEFGVRDSPFTVGRALRRAVTLLRIFPRIASLPL